jgi:UDP-glucose 4-epimerase
MRVVVTGGAGYIGSALVAALRSAHQVWSFDIAPGPDVLEVDLLKSGQFAQALESLLPIDAVYHLAGPVVEKVRKQVALGTTLQVQGTLEVLEACRQLNVRKVLLASSFYVFAGLPEDAVANEETLLDLGPVEVFGAAKLMAERLVRAYTVSYGIEHVIFRFGSVYGHNPRAAGSNVIGTFLERGFAREPIVIWGPGRRRNQYTLLDDVVAGCVAALGARNETFNLVSPYEATTGELAALLRARYGFEIVFDPDKPEGPSMAFMVSRKAVRQLGWRPTPLEVGIKRTVEAAGYRA